MSEQKSFDIDSRKLFNLGANLLIAGFMQQKPEEAKKLYKDLKQGKLVPSGHLTSEKTGLKLPIKLQLDRSEFRGQFNFPNFELRVYDNKQGATFINAKPSGGTA